MYDNMERNENTISFDSSCDEWIYSLDITGVST